MAIYASILDAWNAVTQDANATDEVRVTLVGSSVTITGPVSVTQGTDPWNTNISKINSVTPLMGNGVTGTGSLRVTIASDNTAFNVTANAGTNLNTSLLALESGGNLAAAAASLSVLDDWDESDRAKVNPIVGQAGVQGASGIVTANTQRVVLATDVALPAGTNAIGKLAANDGIDIGDVTINNAAGAAAVNIQDGGNSITVDGTITATIAAGATTIAKAEDSASANADVGVPAMAIRKATPANTSDTDGDYEMLQMSAGRLWVDPSGVTLTVASHNVTNAGTFATQAAITAASGSIVAGAVAAGATSFVKLEDVASADADAGVACLAVRKATPANTSGSDGDYEFLQMSAGRVWTSATIDAALPTGANTIGKIDQGTAGASAWLVTGSVGTSGGMTRFRNTALSNTAVAVKASAGNFYYYHVYNVNAADAFLQIYNVAQGSVTVGTTTPDLTFAIPAGGVLDGSFDSAAFSFSTAITIAATTTITGGTAPSTGLLVAIGYA